MIKDKFKDNMSDNEIRILGTPGNNKPDGNSNLPGRWKKFLLLLMLLMLLAILVAICMIYAKSDKRDSRLNINRSDSLSEETIKTPTAVSKGYISQKDTIINDIPLSIITPHNAKANLYVGKLPENDTNVILAAQAADIRGDKDLPTGAFVCNGELIAKGHAKYGFCAIIGNEITLGRQNETPLFEKAIEENGSFFRQYSLVSNGKLMEIPPKGKSIRRALCLYNNVIAIIETKDRESYHDFSQSLVDLGVKEGLALVGGEGAMLYRHSDGTVIKEGTAFAQGKMSENYIIWK